MLNTVEYSAWILLSKCCRLPVQHSGVLPNTPQTVLWFNIPPFLLLKVLSFGSPVEYSDVLPSNGATPIPWAAETPMAARATAEAEMKKEKTRGNET